MAEAAFAHRLPTLKVSSWAILSLQMDAPAEGPQGGLCPLWWWPRNFSELFCSFMPQHLPHHWPMLEDWQEEENGVTGSSGWSGRREKKGDASHIPILLLTQGHPQHTTTWAQWEKNVQPKARKSRVSSKSPRLPLVCLDPLQLLRNTLFHPMPASLKIQLMYPSHY